MNICYSKADQVNVFARVRQFSCFLLQSSLRHPLGTRHRCKATWPMRVPSAPSFLKEDSNIMSPGLLTHLDHSHSGQSSTSPFNLPSPRFNDRLLSKKNGTPRTCLTPLGNTWYLGTALSWSLCTPSRISSFYVLSHSDFLHSLLMVPLHESVISTYHKHPTSSCPKVNTPMSQSASLHLPPIIMNGTSSQSTKYKSERHPDSLPIFIVLTQALINYLSLVLLHFPVSSFVRLNSE